MHRFRSWLGPCVGFAVLAAILLAGLLQQRTKLSPDPERMRLEWIPDPGGRLSFEEIRSSPDWRLWDAKSHLAGKPGEILWLRVRLTNPDSLPARGILTSTEIYEDLIEAWIPTPDGGWQKKISGESVRISQRPWQALTPAFDVDVPANGEQTVYLRLEDYDYPIAWFLWWPRMEDYFSQQFRDTLAKGLGFGCLVALLLYNLVLWIRLRFPDMGYYVGYAACMTTLNFSSSGATALLGWPAPAWVQVLEGSAIAGGALFILSFARLFLDIRFRMPRMNRLLGVLNWIWMLLLAGLFTIPWTGNDTWFNLVILVGAATHLLLLGVAIFSWIRGYRAARFFVLAFGVWNLCTVSSVFAWGGGSSTPFIIMVFLAGSVLEMLLLSFAMADRFAQAQAKLTEETEQRQLLQETYADELALEVSERTKELELANTDKDRILAVIGHDLRGPLTGLVRSAEDSPGEFAHDASQTGRHLLLLIEDLVLWAKIRAGSPTLTVHEARSLALPSVALHRAIAEQNGIRLAVDIPDSLTVKTDLVQVQTLLRNLLGNALKFARSQVILRAEPVGDAVRFSVSNDGPQLSPEIVERLRTGIDDSSTGTAGGLGLRLCREICQNLGIQLGAESGSAIGTVFHFSLVREGDEKP